MATFKQCESFKHLMAKNLLAEWLRELDNNYDFCKIGKVSWRSNYGVHKELPFYETSSPYYFEQSKGLNPKKECPNFKDYIYKDLYLPNFNKGKILFVPDITIFHKGSVRHFIEVVHKSEPTQKKIGNIQYFFKVAGWGYCDLWLISADHILGQVNKPDTLNFEHYLLFE